MKKALLALSLITLAVGLPLNAGWISVHDIDALYCIFPLSAVFFGMFLVLRVFDTGAELGAQQAHSPAPAPSSHK